MRMESTTRQFLKESEYWVEVRHEDYCGFCKDGIRQDCALAPSDLKRVRVAQFIYFTEALDYAEAIAKRGVSAYVRKPRFQDGKSYSEFSFYPAKGTKKEKEVADNEPYEGEEEDNDLTYIQERTEEGWE